MIPDYFTSVSNFDSKTLLRRILLISIFFEMIGVVLMYSLWDPAIKFESFGNKLFFSIFHAVSAFNNVGLTLFSDGLYSAPIHGSFILHMTFGVLVYFGSLGFSTIRDVFGIKANMERMKLLWKRYSISTKISLYGSLILLAFGAVVFYLLERENTLANMNGIEQVIRSLFQSVNKTSGFNTVIIGDLRSSTLILLIFLMFIGASSGSIGGGIKTSTFTIIMVSAFSTIRGKKNLELFKHNIPWDLLNKAYTIFIFSASFIFISVFVLTILEPEIHIMRIVFEAVSAFATTGWSTGITAQLTTPSKLILIISMFVGRIGTLTIAFALSKRVKTVAYKYPDAEFMVG
jgi:Trk-type K+ transport system membrane component